MQRLRVRTYDSVSAAALEPHPLIGISKQRAFMVDLDATSLSDCVKVAKRAMRWFKARDEYADGIDLQGFAVIESSPGNHHLIFNAYSQSWEQTLKVVAFVIRNVSRELSNDALRWLLMQARKGKLTLRISAKGSGKPAPKIVYRFGRQDGFIAEYEKFAVMIGGDGQ
jgi:hypothetical protein